MAAGVSLSGTRAEFGRQIEDHFRQWETLMFSANQLSPQVKRLAHSPTSKKWSSKKEVPPQNALLVASPKRGLPASWGRKEMGKLSLKRRHRLPDTPKRVTVTPRSVCCLHEGGCGFEGGLSLSFVMITAAPAALSQSIPTPLLFFFSLAG